MFHYLQLQQYILPFGEELLIFRLDLYHNLPFYHQKILCLIAFQAMLLLVKFLWLLRASQYLIFDQIQTFCHIFQKHLYQFFYLVDRKIRCKKFELHVLHSHFREHHGIFGIYHHNPNRHHNIL